MTSIVSKAIKRAGDSAVPAVNRNGGVDWGGGSGGRGRYWEQRKKGKLWPQCKINKYIYFKNSILKTGSINDTLP